MSAFRKQHMAMDWGNLIDKESIVPAACASLEDKAALVGRTGLLILSVGAGAYRVRSDEQDFPRIRHCMQRRYFATVD